MELTNPESLLGQLSLEEKISLLSGADDWQTQEIPRLGIGSLKVSHLAERPISELTSNRQAMAQQEQEVHFQ